MPQDPEILRRLLRAKDRMDAASHEEWPVARLASVSGVSEAHFARSFKAAGYNVPDEWLKGATAVVFCFGDPPAVAKVMGQLANDIDKLVPIVCFNANKVGGCKNMNCTYFHPDIQDDELNDVLSKVFNLNIDQGFKYAFFGGSSFLFRSHGRRW